MRGRNKARVRLRRRNEFWAQECPRCGMSRRSHGRRKGCRNVMRKVGGFYPSAFCSPYSGGVGQGPENFSFRIRNLVVDKYGWISCPHEFHKTFYDHRPTPKARR